MNPENNFSDLAVSTGSPAPDLIRAACWQQYRRHWWQGMQLAMVVAVLSALYWRISIRDWPGYGVFDLMKGSLLWALFILIFVGIPAALGGLLRQPWLLWLSGHARNRGQLLSGAILGFEATVVLAALCYWWSTDMDNAGEPGRGLAYVIGICQFISLPWLLSTSWSTWRLAADLRMPPHAPAAPF